MNHNTLQGRLLSPAGFGLVLLCFFLPFVAVSCGPADERVTATFTGVDMVAGSRPDITGAGLTDVDVETIHTLVGDQYDLEPLALFAALAIMAGMACALIRGVRTRHAAGAALAAGALALLVAAELRAISRLEDVRGGQFVDIEALPDPGVATTRFGFWAAAVVLAALAGTHAFARLRAPEAATTASDPPPPERGRPVLAIRRRGRLSRACGRVRHREP
jgi:hypothetical protein